MKEPRGPDIQYSITIKTVSFSISSTIGNVSKTLGISNTLVMFTLRSQVMPSHVVCSYGCLSNHPEFHQYILQTIIYIGFYEAK